MRTAVIILLAAALVLAALPAPAAGIGDVCKAIGIREKDVMFSSVLTARVKKGGAKQVVAVTTYFTGRKSSADAVNVRLDIFSLRGEKLDPMWSRDYGSEHGGNVGRGDLELVDLDLDGCNDIIVTFDHQDNPLVERRLGEIILTGEEGFEIGWQGIMRLDATRDARSIPVERRDHFIRQVDIPRTLKTRGATLFLTKQVLAVAGERLEPPKEITETFPLWSALKAR